MLNQFLQYQMNDFVPQVLRLMELPQNMALIGHVMVLMGAQLFHVVLIIPEHTHVKICLMLKFLILKEILIMTLLSEFKLLHLLGLVCGELMDRVQYFHRGLRALVDIIVNLTNDIMETWLPL